MKRALLVLLLAGLGCRAATPEATLEEYRKAIAHQDAARVRALSDSTYRQTYDDADVRAALNDASSLETVERLRTVRNKREHADFALADGSTLTLALEDGAWRVTGGGLEPAAFDTPEHALETFFRAVATRRLRLVRMAIPSHFRDGLATDEALERHLSKMESRISKARERIGPILAGRATIEGTTAELEYGPGLSVTFESEDGGWRIIDVE